jgi:hypothetical protein
LRLSRCHFSFPSVAATPTARRSHVTEVAWTVCSLGCTKRATVVACASVQIAARIHRMCDWMRAIVAETHRERGMSLAP